MTPQPVGAEDYVEEFEGLGPLFGERLRIAALADHLCEASKHRQSAEGRSNPEGEIVLPFLRQLGWDVGDESVVKPGFQMTAGIIDFALCVPPQNPQVLVKIGSLPGNRDPATVHPFDDVVSMVLLYSPSGLPGNRDPAIVHPFDDSTPRAIQLAVSEDARIWRLHFPAGRGRMRNREFARFELVRASALGMAEAFDRFLAFRSIESGEAWRQAEREYGEKRFASEAKGAWRRTLRGKEVLERFEREMRQAIGVAVDGERTKRFIPRADRINPPPARSTGSENRSPSHGGRQGMGV